VKFSSSTPLLLTTAFVLSVLTVAASAAPQTARKEQVQHEVQSHDLFVADSHHTQDTLVPSTERVFRYDRLFAEETSDREKRAVVAPRAPVPSVAPKKLSVKDMICEAFGPRCEKAIRVAKCESGLRPHAYNKHDPNGGSFGLFQINGIHLNDNGVASRYEPKELFSPAINITVAYKLSNGGKNWGPWACRGA